MLTNNHDEFTNNEFANIKLTLFHGLLNIYTTKSIYKYISNITI